MPSFYECLTKESKTTWDILLRAFNCKVDTVQHDKRRITVKTAMEDTGEIAELMQIVPGFDRSED